MAWKARKLLDRVLVKEATIEANELKSCNPKENNGRGTRGKNSVGEDPIQSTDIPYLQIIANNQQPLAGSHPDLNQLPHFQAQIESGPWLTRGSSAVIPAIYTLYGLRRLVNQ